MAWPGRRIADAVQRYPIVVTEMYCSTDLCPVREVTVRIKDYDRVFDDSSLPCCPICHGALKVHWVRTWPEQIEEEERSARVSVNEQIQRRDHGPVVNLGALSEGLPDSEPDKLSGDEEMCLACMGLGTVPISG